MSTLTGNDVLTTATALMGGDLEDTADNEQYVVPLVNLMLVDLFETNNAVLLNADEEALTEIPSIADADDAIPYRDEIVRGVMPYGMARDIGRVQGNPATGSFIRLYDENKQKYNIGVVSEVTDYYAITDE